MTVNQMHAQGNADFLNSGLLIPFPMGNVTIDRQSVFNAVLSNAVHPKVVQNGNGGQDVSAIFEPNFGLSLSQTINLANSALGTSFTHFNWI